HPRKVPTPEFELQFGCSPERVNSQAAFSSSRHSKPMIRGHVRLRVMRASEEPLHSGARSEPAQPLKTPRSIHLPEIEPPPLGVSRISYVVIASTKSDVMLVSRYGE